MHTPAPARCPNIGPGDLTPPTGCCSNGHHALREFLRGRIYKEKEDLHGYVFHLLREGFCDAPLRSELAHQAQDNVRTADVFPHSYLECVSKLCRTYGVQQGLCRTSRSALLLPLRVPRRTFHPSAWGNRGKSKVALVFLAL